jgi:hypothetical protein
MNKEYLRGLPALIAGVYITIFPFITVAMYGWNVANVLAIIAGVFIAYQLFKLVQWIVKSPLLGLLNFGGQFK